MITIIIGDYLYKSQGNQGTIIDLMSRAELVLTPYLANRCNQSNEFLKQVIHRYFVEDYGNGNGKYTEYRN